MERDLAGEPGHQLARRIFAVAKKKREEGNHPDKKKVIRIGDICTCRSLEQTMACNNPCANFGA